MEELPDSWVSVSLADVVVINPGIDKSQFSDDDQLAFIPMPAVEAETGKIDTTERRAFSTVKTGFTAFATGDVLFAKITPCMENGKMAIVPKLPNGVGFGTTEFHVLRPTTAVEARLIYHFVASSAIRHEAQHQMTGAVGQKRVPKRYLETKDFPLPPINEQRRIVEKIETLFARLDQGEADLRQVQTLLARYRQSVLKAAVTGQLTADWRAENAHRLEHGRDLLARILKTRRETWQGHGKYKEPAAADTTDLPNLPDGWVWSSAGELCECIVPNRDKPKSFSGDIPWITIPDLDDRGYRVSESRTNIGLSMAEAEQYRARIVPKGSVVMTCIGRFGISAVCDRDIVINQQLHAFIVPRGQLDGPFLAFALQAQKERMESVATSTTIAYLNKSNCNNTPVPVPPLEEQLEVSQRIRCALDHIQNLNQNCQTELTRSTALRQSILKQAFAGRLVPQDPNDEPASELLARIRADQPAVKGQTRKKVSA